MESKYRLSYNRISEKFIFISAPCCHGFILKTQESAAPDAVRTRKHVFPPHFFFFFFFWCANTFSSFCAQTFFCFFFVWQTFFCFFFVCTTFFFMLGRKGETDSWSAHPHSKSSYCATEHKTYFVFSRYQNRHKIQILYIIF